MDSLTLDPKFSSFIAQLEMQPLVDILSTSHFEGSNIHIQFWSIHSIPHSSYYLPNFIPDAYLKPGIPNLSQTVLASRTPRGLDPGATARRRAAPCVPSPGRHTGRCSVERAAELNMCLRCFKTGVGLKENEKENNIPTCSKSSWNAKQVCVRERVASDTSFISHGVHIIPSHLR